MAGTVTAKSGRILSEAAYGKALAAPQHFAQLQASTLEKIGDSVSRIADNTAPDPWLFHYGSTLLLTLATVALAVYTARLFKSTADVAKDTLAAAQYADRHHQESLTPFVTVSPRVLLFRLSANSVSVRLVYTAANVGSGAALNAKIILTIEGFSIPFIAEIGSLEAGHRSGEELTEDFPQMEIPPGVDLSAGMAVGVISLLKVNYLNTFGNVASTIYTSRNGVLRQTFAPPSVLPRAIDAPNLFNNAVPDL